MNLYDQLGIDQISSPQEIKRAYFRLVRQFTPEKDPETFKQLRQAYETLYNESERAAYDASLSRYSGVPVEVAAVIMQAEQLGAKKLWKDAIDSLEKSRHFKHNAVQCALCRLYLDMEKSGKAVKIIEKLMKNHPNNVEILKLAIETYVTLGWTNKVNNAMEYLTQLEPDNEDNLSALLFDEMDQPTSLMSETVEKVEENGGKAPLLCAYILRNCLYQENDSADNVQLSFSLTGKKEEYFWESPMFAAKKLAEHTEGISGSIDKREKARIILKNDILYGMFMEDCYSILPHIDQTIKNIGAEELYRSSEYEVVSAGYSALNVVQAGIPKTLAILPLMRVWSQADVLDDDYRAEYRDEVLLAEMDILTHVAFFSPQLRRLKDEFSSFYQLAAEFFDMILNSNENKINNEVQRRINRAMKLRSRLTLDWLGEDDKLYSSREKRSEPVRVTKIGRNEPCPCGSGKKYKKCCGY